MKEYQVLRANIVFKGGPLKRKPEVFDIGGFSVILKDGREVMFDWIESSTGLDLKADESIFDSDFRDFDCIGAVLLHRHAICPMVVPFFLCPRTAAFDNECFSVDSSCDLNLSQFRRTVGVGPVHIDKDIIVVIDIPWDNTDIGLSFHRKSSCSDS